MMKSAVLIGLTGSIASGKSTVGKILAAKGIPVIDLDAVNRTLLDSHPAARAVVENLTGRKLAPQDRPDRQLLREIIFRDPVKRAALEAVLHPLIWLSFQREVENHSKQGKKLIICEAPLLVETGSYKNLQGLLVVLAADNLRRSRLSQRDKVIPELAEKMIRSQLPQAEKEKVATWVLNNDGTLPELQSKTEAWLTKVLSLFAA